MTYLEVVSKIFSVYYNGQSESQEGRREGVGVMKDEELKLEEMVDAALQSVRGSESSDE